MPMLMRGRVDAPPARTVRPAPARPRARCADAAPAASLHAMAVPLFDTTTPLAAIRDRIDAAIAGVVEDGRFILGPNVAAFEAEFADYCGAGHAIGVGNGTDAITLALRALGVGPGDD